MFTLISPISNHEDFVTTQKKYNTPRIPLGTIVLSSVLRSAGIPVRVVDLGMSWYLHKDKYDSFYDFSIKTLLEENSNIYGFSTNCTNIRQSIDIAKFLKKEKHCVVIFGGPGATSCSEYLIKNFKCVDIVVRNEAETIISDLIRSLEEFGISNRLTSIPGLNLRIDGKPVNTPEQSIIEDLDILPFPLYEEYYSTLEKLKELYDFEMALPLDVGRGCYGRCTFCSTACYFRRKARYKSPQRIMSEVNMLHDRFKVNHFFIEHDCFVWNKHKVIGLAEAVEKSPKKFIFDIAARADLIDFDMIQSLKKLGCNFVMLGLESGSERIQKLIKKNLNVKKSLHNIKELTKHFSVRVNFMIGFPEERYEDLSDTLSAFMEVKEEGIETNIGILSPFPGSEIVKNRGVDKLCFDGFFASVVDIPQHNEEVFIRNHPELCSAYYYYDNDNGIERLYFIFLTVVASMYNIAPNISKLTFSPEKLFDLYLLWKVHRYGYVDGFDFNIKKNAEDIFIRFICFIKDCLINDEDNSIRFGLNKPYAKDVWMYDLNMCTVSYRENSYAIQTFKYNVPSVINQNGISVFDFATELVFINSKEESNLFVVKCTKDNRDGIMKYLEDNGIEEQIPQTPDILRGALLEEKNKDVL